MAAAVAAVRKVLAQAKNPRTRIGKMTPTGVAFQVAYAAVTAHRDALESAVRPPALPPGELFTQTAVDQWREELGFDPITGERC